MVCLRQFLVFAYFLEWCSLEGEVESVLMIAEEELECTEVFVFHAISFEVIFSFTATGVSFSFDVVLVCPRLNIENRVGSAGPLAPDSVLATEAVGVVRSSLESKEQLGCRCLLHNLEAESYCFKGSSHWWDGLYMTDVQSRNRDRNKSSLLQYNFRMFWF